MRVYCCDILINVMCSNCVSSKPRQTLQIFAIIAVVAHLSNTSWLETTDMSQSYEQIDSSGHSNFERSWEHVNLQQQQQKALQNATKPLHLVYHNKTETAKH